jgi:hypothetical protein
MPHSSGRPASQVTQCHLGLMGLSEQAVGRNPGSREGKCFCMDRRVCSHQNHSVLPGSIQSWDLTLRIIGQLIPKFKTKTFFHRA